VSQSDSVSTIEELNQFAYTHLKNLALEANFRIAAPFGVERELSTGDFPVRYQILLPEPDNEPLGLVGSDRILRIFVAVVCDKVEDIVHQLVSPEIASGHVTFFSGLDLLSKIKQSQRQVDKELSISNCRDIVNRSFEDLLSNGETSLRFLTKPGNLLKSLKMPVRICGTAQLLLREMALLIYLGRSNEVADTIAFAKRCQPGYLSVLNLTPEEINSIKDIISKGSILARNE
jgi:hypothetical protein